MDSNRFDRIAVALAAGSPRRAALRALAGGALGGALALAGPRPRPAAAADDPVCKGARPVLNNKSCAATVCGSAGGLFDCVCAVSVNGDKRCVATPFACRTEDECDSNRECRDKGLGDVCIK